MELTFAAVGAGVVGATVCSGVVCGNETGSETGFSVESHDVNATTRRNEVINFGVYEAIACLALLSLWVILVGGSLHNGRPNCFEV